MAPLWRPPHELQHEQDVGAPFQCIKQHRYLGFPRRLDDICDTNETVPRGRTLGDLRRIERSGMLFNNTINLLAHARIRPGHDLYRVAAWKSDARDGVVAHSQPDCIMNPSGACRRYPTRPVLEIQAVVLNSLAIVDRPCFVVEEPNRLRSW